MDLIVTGSGTAPLRAERGPSGYILKVAEQTCLLDGGTGTLLKCLQAGVSYKEIDHLFYTHLHPDHTIDLIPFLFATKHTPGFVRTQKLTLFGPEGVRHFLDRLLDLYGRSMVDEAEYELAIEELSDSRKEMPGFDVQTQPMNHSVPAIGYRFEAGGKALVYSGDTDVCREIVDLARGADVLLLECSFPDEMKVTGHLTPTEAGQIAAEARVKKVLLTHLYPPCDEHDIVSVCRKQFRGEVVVAEDFMHIEI